jgi:hypothetical protein
MERSKRDWTRPEVRPLTREGSQADVRDVAVPNGISNAAN